MSVTAVVLVAALAAAVVIWALSSIGRDVDTIDPAVEERWLVAWLGKHPRWGRAVRAVDRRVAGGAMLVAGLVIVFATAAVVGALADMVERNTGLARWDRAVAEWGSIHATDRSTAILDVVTDLGGTLTVVAVATIVAVVDYLRRRNIDVVWFLVTVLVGNAAINNLVKLVVARERPDVPHLVDTSSYSFPSGHSATAAAASCAMALVLTRTQSRRARAIAAAAAALVTGAVAASRALLGVHWLTDVVAGVVMGWGWFLLVALVFGGRIQRLGGPADDIPTSSDSTPVARSSA